jgi:hypothetical protein
VLPSIVGTVSLASLGAVCVVLWKREENRVKKDIQKHLDQLKKEHVGE